MAVDCLSGGPLRMEVAGGREAVADQRPVWSCSENIYIDRSIISEFAADFWLIC